MPPLAPLAMAVAAAAGPAKAPVATAAPTSTAAPRAAGRAYGVSEFRDDAPKVRDDEVFPALCPVCRARHYPRLCDVGQELYCEDCHRAFVVPEPPTLLPEPQYWVEEHGQFDVGNASERPRAEMEYLLVRGTLDPEPDELPPPPKLWYLRGVFTFPWHLDTLAYWGLPSLLFLFSALVATFVVEMLTPLLGDNAILGILLVFGVVFYPVLWGMSLLSSCFTTIVTDTAAGNDKIPNWPDLAWRDWFGQLGWMLYVSLCAGGVSVLVSYPVKLLCGTLAGVAAAGCVVLAVFPTFVVAAIDAENPFFPDLKAMYVRMKRIPRVCIGVYLMTASLAGLGLLGTIAAGRGNAYFGNTVAVLTFTSGAFVYARLLGRFTWRLGQAELAAAVKSGKKRRKRRAGAESVERVAG